MLTSLACCGQEVFDTVVRTGSKSNLFQVKLFRSEDKEYIVNFVNLSDKSLYFVESGSDVVFDTDNKAIILFGEYINDLSDGKFYNVVEVKPNQTEA